MAVRANCLYNCSSFTATIPLQPVCHRADDLHYNESAIEQTTSTTTSLQLSRCRRPLPQLVYSHRFADDLYQGARSRRRRAADEPQTRTITTTTTANLPPLPQTYRRLLSHRATDNYNYNYNNHYYTIGILQMRR